MNLINRIKSKLESAVAERHATYVDALASIRDTDDEAEVLDRLTSYGVSTDQILKDIQAAADLRSAIADQLELKRKFAAERPAEDAAKKLERERDAELAKVNAKYEPKLTEQWGIVHASRNAAYSQTPIIDRLRALEAEQPDLFKVLAPEDIYRTRG